MRFDPGAADAASWLPLAGQVALLAAFAVSPHGILSLGSAAVPLADGLVIAGFACVIAFVTAPRLPARRL